MSKWVDRVQQHGVWLILAAVEPSINAALAKDEVSSDMVDALERLRAVVKFGESRLFATNPVLIPPPVLDNLVQPLSQLKAHVDTFLDNQDYGQLNLANTQADTFLVNLNLVLGIVTPSDLKAISDAAASYHQTLEKNLADAMTLQAGLLGKAAVNDSKITKIEEELTAEQKKLSSILNDQQSQFSSAQDKRASEFAEVKADYLAKYTEAISEQKTQFSADQDTRRTAFADFQRDNQEKLSALLTSYDQKLKDHALAFEIKEKQVDEDNKKNLLFLQEKYESDAEEILSEIRRHKSDVESLVGVIGNLGVTSGYKKVANYARLMVGIWQSLTVLSLAGLIWVALMVAFPNIFTNQNSNEQANQRVAIGVKAEVGRAGADKSMAGKGKATIDDTKDTVVPTPKLHSESDFYQGFLTRIFLSITFGIFAAYAGKQASRFFDMEQKNRKLALELEALGPFIEPLEKADRDKFRVQIGDRSFGVPDAESNKPKEDDPVTALAILKSKELGEVITNIVKAARS
jgi:hypothetical protein